MTAAAMAGSGANELPTLPKSHAAPNKSAMRKATSPSATERFRHLQDRPGNRKAEHDDEEKIAKADVSAGQPYPGEPGSERREKAAYLQRNGERGRDRADPERGEERALHSAGRSPGP